MIKELIKNTISGGILEKYLDEMFSKGRVMEKFVVDGVSVYLDYHFDCTNKHKLEKSRRKEIPRLLDTIRNLPICIKKALTESKVPIILSDAKTIVKRRGKGVGGYYSVNAHGASRIYVGLSNNSDSIKMLFHEIGHFVDEEIGTLKDSSCSCYESENDYYYSERNPLVRKAFNKEASMFRKYARNNTAEFVAVAFEEYLSDKMPKKAIETKYILERYIDSLIDKYEEKLYNVEYEGIFKHLIYTDTFR